MRAGCLIAVLICAAQALAWVALPARAEDQATPVLQSSPASAPPAPSTVPASEPPPTAEAAPAEAKPDPVVQIIRAMLADPSLGKGANADDLAAVQAFYASRTAGPLWTTEMGFSAKGQAALFGIGNADDWGLDASAFELPPAGALPAKPEDQAIAEIKLDLAVLKYARFARGGRFNPPELSVLLDQTPHVRDPRTVLAEIAAADAPDRYLQSLHPKHEQFGRLRQALLKARGKEGAEQAEVRPAEANASDDAKKPGEAAKKAGEGTNAKPAASDKDIKRIIMNMERWRWMPEDLGPVYVWNNSPEFMLYVVKDGKKIYADKTLVGTIGYATPVFTADMTNIIFNPDWIAPETVVTENLLPALRDGNYSILKIHKLSVSYNGTPVDPTRVDWGRVNILSYAFSQRAGPENVLGKVKFWFPNKHTVYMHDTLPVRKKYFKQPVRMIGHECVRMEKPLEFANVLLAAGKGWSTSQVKEQWDNGVNSSVIFDHKIPVHMTYFTAVVDDAGKLSTFADVYGLDNKMATAMFGSAAGFPVPPPEPKKPQGEEASTSRPASRTASGGNDIAGSLSGFVGD
ncbi:MAG: L,D-transpeptidase family protein [Methyloceanibacter sp.]